MFWGRCNIKRQWQTKSLLHSYSGKTGHREPFVRLIYEFATANRKLNEETNSTDHSFKKKKQKPSTKCLALIFKVSMKYTLILTQLHALLRNDINDSLLFK